MVEEWEPIRIGRYYVREVERGGSQNVDFQRSYITRKTSCVIVFGGMKEKVDFRKSIQVNYISGPIRYLSLGTGQIEYRLMGLQ